MSPVSVKFQGLILLLILCAFNLGACATFQQPSDEVVLTYAYGETSIPQSFSVDRDALMRGEVKVPGLPLELYQDIPEIASVAVEVYRSPSVTIKECSVQKPLNYAPVKELEVSLADRWLRNEDGKIPVEDNILPPYASSALNKALYDGDFSNEGQTLTSGLNYEVWYKDIGEQESRYLIVFRGTDFRSRGDWCANLRPLGICRGQIDQYRQLEVLIGPLLSEIKDHAAIDNRVPTIYAVGHSLGGGLAQKAGYLSPEIQVIYAFNASPLTGFLTDPTSGIRPENYEGQVNFRISERGEIMAPLRYIARRFTPISSSNPQIIEVRYSLNSGLYPFVGWIANHSMDELACGLRKVEARVAD